MLLGLLIIGTVIVIKFKPMYSVKLGNNKLGYLKRIEDIDQYIEEVKNSENIAFVELKEKPEFKMNLVSRSTKDSEEEIKEKIQNNLSIEYTSYAITYQKENIAYLSNMDKAEEVIDKLKKENNIKDLEILQVYSDNYDEITAQESDIAVKKITTIMKEANKLDNKVKIASSNKTKTDVKSSNKIEKTSNNKSKDKKTKNKAKIKSSGKEKTTKTTSKKIAINLSKPLSGTITSRFGGRRSPGGIGSTNHKGLDIASKRGSTIKAAASGIVKFAGYKGSLGKLVIIDHGNGTQTYYGHSSKLYVKKGQKVEVGEKIAAVGSTGAATGPHLHFEVHINGVVVNPQNYVY